MNGLNACTKKSLSVVIYDYLNLDFNLIYLVS